MLLSDPSIIGIQRSRRVLAEKKEWIDISKIEKISRNEFLQKVHCTFHD